ncbi:MAG TPA: hypothetical protein VJS64_08825, partial [Pyrinomonadaceae bacterium]|nr:hypothetical protein [Pyrinomonadaceae bacterium]
VGRAFEKDQAPSRGICQICREFRLRNLTLGKMPDKPLDDRRTFRVHSVRIWNAGRDAFGNVRIDQKKMSQREMKL